MNSDIGLFNVSIDRLSLGTQNSPGWSLWKGDIAQKESTFNKVSTGSPIVGWPASILSATKPNLPVQAFTEHLLYAERS